VPFGLRELLVAVAPDEESEHAEWAANHDDDEQRVEERSDGLVLAAAALHGRQRRDHAVLVVEIQAAEEDDHAAADAVVCDERGHMEWKRVRLSRDGRRRTGSQENRNRLASVRRYGDLHANVSGEREIRTQSCHGTGMHATHFLKDRLCGRAAPITGNCPSRGQRFTTSHRPPWQSATSSSWPV
jgi:hypothetical protein